MKPSRIIQGTFLTMIVVQSVGSIDRKHRLPSPRQFGAIAVLWGIFFLMADTALNKAAARLSVLVLLTGMVIGPFGKLTVKFLNTVAQNFAIQPPDTAANPATGATGDTII